MNNKEFEEYEIYDPEKYKSFNSAIPKELADDMRDWAIKEMEKIVDKIILSEVS